LFIAKVKQTTTNGIDSTYAQAGDAVGTLQLVGRRRSRPPAAASPPAAPAGAAAPRARCQSRPRRPAAAASA
ncbi:MAG: hypothetical protein MZV70_10905, partial [Desulfobacterales bacterium]|nr:hypothetical protein [Desulfobacterales bacterium]